MNILYDLKIYLNNKVGVFAEVTLDNITRFNNLAESLNDPKIEFVKFGDVIFRKTDFKYAVITPIKK